MFINLEGKEVNFVLENNYIGQLAYIFHNKPYVVPITYYYNQENNTIICYSGVGHKMEAMRKNSAVSLLVADIDSVINWKSVAVHGKFEECFGSDAKAYLHKFTTGVKEVMLQKELQEVNFISEFSSRIFNDTIPVVFSIKIEEITGKKRNILST
jgi:nitroimidazol reductase NimA-like FMN-containing flavoprotein (pyridoxamine 5'-phosphate oxidase superfamily)